MEEDPEDRKARLKKEKEEKQLHKIMKLAHALRMDVKVVQAMQDKAQSAKKELRIGNKPKELVWRRRGLMKTEIEKMADVLTFQRLIGREAITNLDLRTNLVCKGGAAALAKCLKTSATLTRLDLSENCLGDAGAVAMAELLFPEGSLVRLELGGNKIGLAGVGALAEALEQAPGLKHLGLGFNQLCHSGVRPLADAALGHLETLDLRGNIMDERAARVLAEGVIESTAITMIDVRENPNSREATAILGKAMRDRVRRFKEKQRQAKKLARKERRKYDEPGPLPPMEYYWLEPHTLRALPGNGALARAATRVCAVS